MLSICVTIKNRSRVRVDSHELLLFPSCVRSIVQAAAQYPSSELVIADWRSDDWPLVDWIEQAAAPVPVRLVRVEGTGFSRGKGLNLAASVARHEALLFLDADCLLCETVISRGLECVRQGKAYFPVLFSFAGPEHRGGWWRHEGHGICLLSRELFRSSGGWPEYSSWGKEDDDFLDRIRALAGVVRERVPGFYHQWHPNDVAWKDRYADLSPAELLAARKEREAQQEALQAVARELEQVIPHGRQYILVDEAWLGSAIPPGRIALPFLERDGQYWGLPPDDETAILELKRMRGCGSRFMAFARPAFWWLDHYRGLHQFLRASFACVSENERLIVFDLGDDHP